MEAPQSHPQLERETREIDLSLTLAVDFDQFRASVQVKY